MVIKRATKSKAAQRKGAIGNWKVNLIKKKKRKKKMIRRNVQG
jgi:hypothetical protein